MWEYETNPILETTERKGNKEIKRTRNKVLWVNLTYDSRLIATFTRLPI